MMNARNKTKLERCMAMDAIYAELMRVIAESDAVDDSHALGLLEPLVDMSDTIKRYHTKLTVIYQTELRGLN